MNLTFVAKGDQTEVTLHHSGVPDDEMGRMHGQGWTWVLSMLAAEPRQETSSGEVKRASA